MNKIAETERTYMLKYTEEKIFTQDQGQGIAGKMQDKETG